MTAIEVDLNDCLNGLGNVGACHDLARKFRLSKNDYNTAIDILAKGCEKDFGPSCHELGVILLQGKGVVVDHKRGVESITKACQFGIPDSCNLLATATNQGAYGLESSFVSARDIWKKSCFDNASPMNCFSLAGKLLAMTPQQLANRDSATAASKPEVDSNSPLTERTAAAFDGGWLGVGWQRDVPGAKELLSWSCLDLGSPGSCRTLAALHRNGDDGVERNPLECRRILHHLVGLRNEHYRQGEAERAQRRADAEAAGTECVDCDPMAPPAELNESLCDIILPTKKSA